MSRIEHATTGQVMHTAPPVWVRTVAGLSHTLKLRGKSFRVLTGFVDRDGHAIVRCQVFLGRELLLESDETCSDSPTEQRRCVVKLHKQAIMDLMSGGLEAAVESIDKVGRRSGSVAATPVRQAAADPGQAVTVRVTPPANRSKAPALPPEPASPRTGANSAASAPVSVPAANASAVPPAAKAAAPVASAKPAASASAVPPAAKAAAPVASAKPAASAPAVPPAAKAAAPVASAKPAASAPAVPPAAKAAAPVASAKPAAKASVAPAAAKVAPPLPKATRSVAEPLWADLVDASSEDILVAAPAAAPLRPEVQVAPAAAEEPVPALEIELTVEPEVVEPEVVEPEAIEPEVVEPEVVEPEVVEPEVVEPEVVEPEAVEPEAVEPEVVEPEVVEPEAVGQLGLSVAAAKEPEASSEASESLGVAEAESVDASVPSVPVAASESTRDTDVTSVEKARMVLADLSAMDAFTGLGVFSETGQLVSSLVSGHLDIASIGKDYVDLIGSMKKAMQNIKSSDLHIARFETGDHVTAVASFDPYFKELGVEELSGALSFVVVVMHRDSPFDAVLEAVKMFMKLIVKDLRDFALRGKVK